MRLFIDIDDTLVIYDDDGQMVHPYGIYMDEPWEPNQKLLDGIRKFHEENPSELIVLWSGGGKDYAKMWAHRLEIESFVLCMAKDSKAEQILVQKDSIVVDDQNMGGIRTHYPHEWPEN